MRCRSLVLLSLIVMGWASIQSPARAQIYEPRVVATIIIDGIDSDGPSASGIVGEDTAHSLIPIVAALIDAPAGYQNPMAPNQVTMARHYGDKYPSYYSSSDRKDVDDLTDEYGGGIPRYAAIIAKFSRQVMQRSGAKQVNIVGLSMGAYIGRWIIEKDYEGLASTGKIARFVTVEGVVCGNWACNAGGSVLSLLEDDYFLPAIDAQHMVYDWLEENLHDPRTEMDNPLYAGIQVMHWASTDDSPHQRVLTIASGEPNDGVQIYEDTFFHQVTDRSKYFGQRPTLSHIYATHNTAKDHTGIRAGLIANLTSTRRVRITLLNAQVTDMPESGQGEVVFGCRIKSPLAKSRYGITEPINQIDNLGHTIDPVKMREDERVTLNQVLFDDFVLPGEQSLTIDFDVREIDFDTFYGIIENPLGGATQSIKSNDVIISTLQPAEYAHNSGEWNGRIRVEIINYPGFVPAPAEPLKITNLSRGDYQVANSDLRAGRLLYMDRTYVFSDPIPPTLFMQTYIRTRQADRDTTSPAAFLSFDVNQKVVVYVGIDQRIATPPSWLQDWQKESIQLQDTDHGSPARILYSKRFPAGKISLGPNREPGMPSGQSMYSVVIVPQVTAVRDWMIYR